MSLGCTFCGAPLSADSAGPSGTVSCRHCGALAALDPKDRARLLPRGATVRPPVPMPPRFHLDEAGGSLRVWWRWPRRRTAGFVLGLFVWGLYGAYAWLGTLVGLSDDPTGVVQPILHALAGVVLLYGAALGLVNRTTIHAQRGSLRITHGPLPWPGGATLTDLRQLWARRCLLRHDENDAPTYELWAVTRDGRQHRLVGALEQRLGIEDQAVPGELPRH